MDESTETHVFRGVWIATLVGLGFQLFGYLMLHRDGSAYGLAVFAVVPFVAGFLVAGIVRHPVRVLACTWVSLILNFSILIFWGLEGIICCLMAAPLMATAVGIGALVGYCVWGRFMDRSAHRNKMLVVLMVLSPWLIAAADRMEQPSRDMQAREVYTSQRWLNAPPEEVWHWVAAMPALEGPRPFLLWLGLPTPYRCDIDGRGVGAKRVCYFDQGQVSQQVTAWQPEAWLGLSVTESTLPGRHWLSLIDASYELVAEEGGTRVIRRTTIGSRLYPRWYWRPLERWGIASEHAFVLANLSRWAEARP